MSRGNVLERYEEVKKASDFNSWTGDDLSELFWLTFIEYRKNPTSRGMETIWRISAWAGHADHTLSNTIHNVFKWCGMSLIGELRKYKED